MVCLWHCVDVSERVKVVLPPEDCSHLLSPTTPQVAETGRTEPAGAVGKAQAPSSILMKLQRTTPYYKRNKPHICSFWIKVGVCVCVCV